MSEQYDWFAWFPVKTKNSEWVWFKNVKVSIIEREFSYTFPSLFDEEKMYSITIGYVDRVYEL